MIRTSRLLPLAAAGLAVALAAPIVVAERGDDADRKSKNGKVEATVDGVDVVIEYGRPQVREREIFGALVPYGKVWRTGADEATTIEVSADVLVEGQALAAGKYALFTIPGETSWTFVFNSEHEQWGAYDHAEAKDVLRVEVEPKAGGPTEELTFTVKDGMVALHWADVVVGFSIAGA